jgi:hypothetical protein
MEFSQRDRCERKDRELGWNLAAKLV